MSHLNFAKRVYFYRNEITEEKTTECLIIPMGIMLPILRSKLESVVWEFGISSGNKKNKNTHTILDVTGVN